MVVFSFVNQGPYHATAVQHHVALSSTCAVGSEAYNELALHYTPVDKSRTLVINLNIVLWSAAHQLVLLKSDMILLDFHQSHDVDHSDCGSCIFEQSTARSSTSQCCCCNSIGLSKTLDMSLSANHFTYTRREIVDLDYTRVLLLVMSPTVSACCCAAVI